jgi:hypothetical protein
MSKRYTIDFNKPYEVGENREERKFNLDKPTKKPELKTFISEERINGERVRYTLDSSERPIFWSEEDIRPYLNNKGNFKNIEIVKWSGRRYLVILPTELAQVSASGYFFVNEDMLTEIEE